MKKFLDPNSKNKKNFMRSGVTFVVILCLALLMLLNTAGGEKISYDLSEENGKLYTTEWTPHMTLPSGEYTISVSGDNASSSESIYLTSSDGTVYASLRDNRASFRLDKDVTELCLGSDNGNINLNRVTVSKDGRIFSDTYLLILLFMLALLLMIYFKWFMPESFSTDAFIYMVLIALGVFATYPYFNEYLQHGDDISFHLARIEGVKDGLLSGQFPVRIDPDTCAGYGYPTGLFYGNLFLYFPAVLRICGVSAITAYKTMCLGINIATALISYYAIKGITKSRYTGFVGAVIYTLATWRIICMVSRAAVGESLSMMVLPLIIYGMYEILLGDKKKWYVLSIGFTMLCQSHVINTLISGILAAVLSLCFIKPLIKDRRIIELLKAAGLTVLLNMWFIVPFIISYTGVDMNIHHSLSAGNFRQGAIIPTQLFNVFNDKIGISNVLSTGVMGDMSLSLGIIPTFGVVLSLIYVVFAKKQRLKEHKFFVCLFLFTVAVIYMSTSLFPWDYLRDKFGIIHFFENTLQFPWRFLTIATLTLSVMTAILIGFYSKNSHRAAVCVVVLAVLSVVMFSSAYTENGNIWLSKGESVIDSTSVGATGEYFPNGRSEKNYMPEKYTKSGKVTIEDYEKNGTNIFLTLSGAENGDYVEVPLIYYPGYTAKSDSGKLSITSGTNGVVKVGLSKGTSQVKIRYGGYLPYILGNIVTLITLLLCVLYKPLKNKYGYMLAKENKKELNEEEING